MNGGDGEVEREAEQHEQVLRNRPRIYVASLTDYNAGILHGDWLTADQDPDDLQTAIDEMLARSPTSGAEEFAVHDFEGFGTYGVAEYDSLDWLSRIARGIGEHGLAFAAWAQQCDNDEDQLARFEDAYLGEWESLTTYVEEMLDDLGYGEMLERAVPEWLQAYVSVDVEGFARDLELSGDVHAVQHDAGVWVFDERS